MRILEPHPGRTSSSPKRFIQRDPVSCTRCGILTRQKTSICVLCDIGVPKNKRLESK